MNILKQSTAVTIKLGPYLDSTDAVTAKTALTIAQANVLLSKNFGAFAQKSDATSATHDSSGWYGVPLNTTDTGTVGPLQIHTNISTALPVFRQYLVVPANVYDSLTGAANLKVDVDQIKTGSTAASNLAASTAVIFTGTTDNTAFTGTTTQFETSSITTAAASHWIGRVIIFTTGTLTGQATKITAYSLATGRGHFTYDTLTSAPANGVGFVIV